MRMLKTIFWLAGATLAGLFTVYLNIIPEILVPLLFGLAVNFSNQEYMKYKLSEWAIPITFIAIFLWGTVPFYMLGGFIFENKFGATFFGAVGSFLLVSITLKLTLKEVYIGYVQLLVTFICAFIAVDLHAMFTGQSIKNYDRGITERIDLTVAIFQSLMIVPILTTMIRIPVKVKSKEHENN